MPTFRETVGPPPGPDASPGPDSPPTGPKMASAASAGRSTAQFALGLAQRYASMSFPSRVLLSSALHTAASGDAPSALYKHQQNEARVQNDHQTANSMLNGTQFA